MSSACQPQAEAETETKAAAPKELHGFELVREHFVQEYDSQVLMYRHKKTGISAPVGSIRADLGIGPPQVWNATICPAAYNDHVHLSPYCDHLYSS